MLEHVLQLKFINVGIEQFALPAHQHPGRVFLYDIVIMGGH
jgi:hypothetical protein